MRFSKSFSAFSMLAALTLSAPAWADIPPADQCMEDKLGQACDNAEGEGTELQPGVCKQAMCTRATPDGSMTYACYRCVAEGHGAGGQSGEGGEGGSAGSSPVPEPAAGSGGTSASGGSAASGTAGTKTSAGGSAAEPASDSDGGCSVSHARGGAGAGAFAALVAMGLAAVGLLRRRAS